MFVPCFCALNPSPVQTVYSLSTRVKINNKSADETYITNTDVLYTLYSMCKEEVLNGITSVHSKERPVVNLHVYMYLNTITCVADGHGDLSSCYIVLLYVIYGFFYLLR